MRPLLLLSLDIHSREKYCYRGQDVRALLRRLKAKPSFQSSDKETIRR